MKYILLPFLFFASLLSAENIKLCPIYDDQNFGFDRVACIDCSIARIDEFTRYAPIPVREKIERELIIIKFNLGFYISDDELKTLLDF